MEDVVEMIISLIHCLNVRPSVRRMPQFSLLSVLLKNAQDSKKEQTTVVNQENAVLHFVKMAPVSTMTAPPIVMDIPAQTGIMTSPRTVDVVILPLSLLLFIVVPVEEE